MFRNNTCKKNFLFAASFLSMFYSLFAPITSSAQTLKITNRAVWYWDVVSKHSEQEIRQLVRNVKRQGFNTLIINIEDYVHIAHKRNDPKLLANYERILDAMLAESIEQGIVIEGLLGDTSWATNEYKYIPLNSIDLILAYNKSRPNKPHFSGVHLDIEFYNHPEFSYNKKLYSEQFLSLLVEITSKIKSQEVYNTNHFRLGVAIPFWFDNPYGYVPAMKWSGVNKSFAAHIYDILNHYTYTYTAIMAYRNFTGGSGGSIELVRGEIEYANKFAHNVKVLMGIETASNEILRITFFGKKKSDVTKAINEICIAYCANNSFGGVIIHHWKSYLQLR